MSSAPFGAGKRWPWMRALRLLRRPLSAIGASTVSSSPPSLLNPSPSTCQSAVDHDHGPDRPVDLPFLPLQGPTNPPPSSDATFSQTARAFKITSNEIHHPSNKYQDQPHQCNPSDSAARWHNRRNRRRREQHDTETRVQKTISDPKTKSTGETAMNDNARKAKKINSMCNNHLDAGATRPQPPINSKSERNKPRNRRQVDMK